MTVVYQARFLAYCRWHGREPEAQLKHDRHMANYMAWVGDRHNEWCREVSRPSYWDRSFSVAEREAFTAWLEIRVDAYAAQRAPAAPEAA